MREVTVLRGSNPPSTAAFAAARALAGTTLTAGDVVDVLTGFARGAPRRQEIVLTIERPGGAPGFTATLVLSRVIPARLQDQWVRDDQVRARDDDAIRAETTELGDSDPRDPATHAPLAAAIEKALAAPPSAEVWIQVRLTTGLERGE